MRRRNRVALVLACGLLQLGSLEALAQKKNPEGVPVLMLSGGQRQHHGYRDQALALSRALEDTGRFQVTICEDAAVLETPARDRYRAILLMADRRDPEFKLSAGQQARLVEFVRDAGGGLVLIHGGDNAAPDWSRDLRLVMGGVFSHDTSTGRPNGKTRKGDYRVTITAREHPICRGVSDFEIKDELYYHMQMEPGVTELATTEYEGTHWPVAWVLTPGKGRVFHTNLGHRDFGPDKPDPLQNPSLRQLVEQGLTWTVE